MEIVGSLRPIGISTDAAAQPGAHESLAKCIFDIREKASKGGEPDLVLRLVHFFIPIFRVLPDRQGRSNSLFASFSDKFGRKGTRRVHIAGRAGNVAWAGCAGSAARHR
jgi:hypothetical protein